MNCRIAHTPLDLSCAGTHSELKGSCKIERNGKTRASFLLTNFFFITGRCVREYFFFSSVVVGLKSRAYDRNAICTLVTLNLLCVFFFRLIFFSCLFYLVVVTGTGAILKLPSRFGFKLRAIVKARNFRCVGTTDCDA